MFKGSNVALITPFKNDKLDEEAYIKLIHFQINNGTNGLVPARNYRRISYIKSMMSTKKLLNYALRKVMEKI